MVEMATYLGQVDRSEYIGRSDRLVETREGFEAPVVEVLW